LAPELHVIHFAQKDILPVLTPSHPPWFYSKSFLDLLIGMQNLTPALEFSKVTSWQFVTNYLTIITYTDGSKMNNSVAVAAVSREEAKSLRIPDKASIFTAELVALNLALDVVWHSRHNILSYSYTLCLVSWLFRTCKLNLDTL